MDDLIAFLRARLDEDEAEATAADQGRLLRMSQRGDTIIVDAGFIQTFTPDRMLAAVASARRIIDDVVPDVRGLEDRIDGEWGCGSSAGYEESETLLRLLALPFSDHPDYRKEWTP